MTGRFRTSNDMEESKEKGKSMDVPKETKMDIINAAKEILASWKEMWETDPKSLVSVLRLVYIVWEHKSAIKFLHQNNEIWYQLQALVQIDLGPAPPHEVEVFVIEYEPFKRS